MTNKNATEMSTMEMLPNEISSVLSEGDITFLEEHEFISEDGIVIPIMITGGRPFLICSFDNGKNWYEQQILEGVVWNADNGKDIGQLKIGLNLIISDGVDVGTCSALTKEDLEQLRAFIVEDNIVVPLAGQIIGVNVEQD